MNPFEPADGEKGRWHYCYQLAQGRKNKEAILYQEVEELLNCTRQQAIQAMYEARKHLEADKVCLLKTVAGFGWVVEDALGGLDIVEGRRKKAGRAARRGIRAVNAVDRAELSQIDRARLDHEARKFIGLQGIYDRRPPELLELEAESKRRQQPQLPLRRSESEPA